MSSIAERLQATRRARWVGRESEKALFRDILSAPELPVVLLHFHGPGGIGKTTLLDVLQEICAETGTPSRRIDGRTVDATPMGFSYAVGIAGEVPKSGRTVLFVDTYERLTGLDGWLRETFLPGLPDETLVVLSGRQPLADGWRSDVGWQALVKEVPLGNFTADECTQFLQNRAVPEVAQAAVLSFTHGYPLALALVADICAQRGELPVSSPDVVQTLLRRFLDDVPTPQHREALEASALLRVTTEPALAALLAVLDARELFDWLGGLSFFETSASGLFPHDMAREALIADLRWRSLERHTTLHRRARRYFTERLMDASPTEQQRLLWDYIFLHQDNPVVRSAFAWQDTISAFAEMARPADLPLLGAMVERFEGTELAALFRHWQTHPACQILVYRNTPSGEPLGFLMILSLEGLTSADCGADSRVANCLRYLQQNAPLQPGERATCFPFWMAADSYHGVSPLQSLILVQCVRHYLTTPRLAYAFFPCHDPDAWLSIFTYAEFQHLPELDFTVQGKPHGFYGHDWREMPPLRWLEVLGEKEEEMAASSGNIAPPASAPPLTPCLSEDAFAAAVRDALKNMANPENLSESPLLEARCVVGRSNAAAPTSARILILHRLLLESIEALQQHPKQARAYRVLYRTFVQPAPTQERAAEILDLPFSTYRRHLGEGITHVTKALWRQEQGHGKK